MSYFRPQKAVKIGPRTRNSFSDSTSRLSQNAGQVRTACVPIPNCLNRGVHPTNLCPKRASISAKCDKDVVAPVQEKRTRSPHSESGTPEFHVAGCKMGAGYRVFLPLPRSLTDARETSCLISLHGC